jgi:transketolase
MTHGEPIEKLEKIARLIRYYSLLATTQAGSGHPTSALSATDLMTGLVFGGSFKYDVDNPAHPNNDRLIFSKGHASPLFYALWATAGKLTEQDMMTYRHFGSSLEGHPTTSFRYTEAATGSLGQGLAIGVGMALNARIDKLPYRTYVLLGDSEMAEGSQWESIQIGAHYRLDNLIGVLDVNRLGQRGETMYGHDLNAYDQRISSFGWQTIRIDGHSLPDILSAFDTARQADGRPVMIIAKTIKGKGAPMVEDKNGWHGKPLDEQMLEDIFRQWGKIDKSVRGTIVKPENLEPWRQDPKPIKEPDYTAESDVPTRTAYGNGLVRIYPKYPGIVSLDAEVSNSTRAKRFKEAYPDRFFEMYIAEQNMAGAALGFSRRGKIPFVSTFSAFLSRAFDQIRMSRYSDANITFVGSHAGVSIGLDGPSQMGLEDLAMFRTILDAAVLYPADAISTERLVEQAAQYQGITYIRTTRGATPIIYHADDHFPIGGSKVLKQSDDDLVTIVAAGITLHETLKAYARLQLEDIKVRVIDAYSIKPMDEQTLVRAVRETRAIVTVEDHYAEGGLGEAVRSALANHPTLIASLAVRKKPKSGKPDELLDFEDISSSAIINKVKEITETMNVTG